MTNQEFLQNQKTKLETQGFAFKDFNFDKPWGGFFVLADESKDKFISTFYPELKEELNKTDLPLSPKFLCVAPNQRLSWQYHFRRAELWKLIEGVAGYIKSDTDDQGEVEQMINGDTLKLAQGERHRLVGLNGWGVIAEIWKHTDADFPSNEDDIVRLQDDFGR
jgi:mannose-6-phosphate isomerase